MNPRVKTVVATEGYKLEITFSNGEVGVFKELRDISYFKQAHVESDTVSWPNDQDICPDTLYADSKKLISK